jgi:hypothetical protein
MSTLHCDKKSLIKKRRQLTNGKVGIYWVLSKHKKGYLKINKSLWSLLNVTFNNHLHVIVLRNSKDTLQVKNKDGVMVAVQKIMTMVGLGRINSNIVS